MRLGETSDRVVTDAPTARKIDITPRRKAGFVVEFMERNAVGAFFVVLGGTSVWGKYLQTETAPKGNLLRENP